MTDYIGDQILRLFKPSETDLSGLKRFDELIIAFDTVEIVAAVLAIAVVFLITARQVQTNLARGQGSHGL